MSLGRGPHVVPALVPTTLLALLALGAAGGRPPRAAPRPSVVGGDPGRVADALAAEVESLIVTGRYWEPATAAKLDSALRVRERDAGRDSLPLASVLEVRGRLFEARWDESGAIVPYEHALAIRQRALGEADPATIEAMRRLGLAWLGLRGGRPCAADSLIARSSTLAARVFTAEAPERIDSNEASAFLAEARGQASWPLFTSVLERTERAFAPTDLRVADRLVIISERLRGTARSQEAAELMKRAHAIYAQRLGEANLLTAKSWNLIGVNHVWSQQFAQALPYFEQSLATIRSLVGPEHIEMVKPLLDLGDVECRLGNPADGMPYLEQALAIAERRLPPDDGLTALALRMLGEQYLDAGRISEARALLERRLAWDLRTRRPGHPDIAWTEDLLAGAIDDSKRQRQLYEDVSRTYLAFYGPEHPRGARARMLAAQYRFADGDTLGAIALCDSVVDTFDRVRGAESVEAAWARWTLGNLDLVAHRTDAAVKEIERAVAGFTASVGPDHVYTAISLRGLAMGLLVAGRPRDAFAAAERAEAIHRGLLEDNARAMAESRALQLPASPYLSIASGTDVMLSLALGPLAGDAAVRRATWDAVIRSRAVVQETVLERHQGWLDGSDAALAALAARFDSSSRRLAQLVVRGPSPDRPQEFTGELARARAQREVVEAELATASHRP